MSFRSVSAYAPQILPRDGSRIRSLVAFFAEMVRAIETRRQLAEMDDRMLSDIGISRAEAQAETDRLAWDLGPPRRSEAERGAIRRVRRG
jgi:uncharacterized protein YjiS (DUF1127 family)